MTPNIKHWTQYWLPPLLWMLIISLFSTDHFSGQQTSRFIGPLLRFFMPGVEDATISTIQLIIRKTGHLTEYAILFLLWFRTLHRYYPKPLNVWNTWTGARCLCICAGYAALDEWHQTLTSHRVGSPLDVGLDSLGATIALFWVRWRNRFRKEN